MSQLADCHESGLLLVLARPKSPACEDEFHEWYNTEHGPARMQLDFIKNGYRYRSKDLLQPVWAGIYDVARLSALTEPAYTNLRKFRSAREQYVMSHKLDILERKICRLLDSRGSDTRPAPVISKESFIVKDQDVDDASRWFDKIWSNVPGWRRSRRFEVVEGELPTPGHTEFLVIHEFDLVTDLEGLDHPTSQLQLKKTTGSVAIERRSRLQMTFHHEFRAEDYRMPLREMCSSPASTKPRFRRSEPVIAPRISARDGQADMKANMLVSAVV